MDRANESGCMSALVAEYGPQEGETAAHLPTKANKNNPVEDIHTGVEILRLTALHGGHHNLSRNQVQGKSFLKRDIGREVL